MTLCISADSHVTEPPDTYIDRIDAAYADRAPRLHYDATLGDVMLIDNGQSLVPYWLVAAAGRPSEEVRLDSGRTFAELHRGGWDPAARLVDQDRDGVAAEVIYPSVGMLLCNHPDVDYQRALLPGLQPLDRRVLRPCARAARSASARPRCEHRTKASATSPTSRRSVCAA